jgi:cytochrome b561
MLISLPLTGYLHRVAGDHPVSFFGWFTWPVLAGKSESLRVLTGKVHLFLAFTLMGLLGLHFMAVIKHVFINRDGLLKRMSFFN